MRYLLASILLAGCVSHAKPTPNLVIDVVAKVAPGAKCTARRPYGSLDVALCEEGPTLLLCTGGGPTPVKCVPAFYVPERPPVVEAPKSEEPAE